MASAAPTRGPLDQPMWAELGLAHSVTGAATFNPEGDKEGPCSGAPVRMGLGREQHSAARRASGLPGTQPGPRPGRHTLRVQPWPRRGTHGMSGGSKAVLMTPA